MGSGRVKLVFKFFLVLISSVGALVGLERPRKLHPGDQVCVGEIKWQLQETCSTSTKPRNHMLGSMIYHLCITKMKKREKWRNK